MLTRWFPLYVKKRGHRRTGSARAGWLGEAIFSTSLALLGGLGVAALLSWWIVPNWQANHDYVANTCVVLDKRVAERETVPGTIEYRPEVFIEYTADGQPYRHWAYGATREHQSDRAGPEQALEGFAVGERYPCWHAADDPRRVVLVRDVRWWLWLWLLIPGSLMAIGLGGLVWTMLHWHTSAERRLALVNRVPPLDPLSDERSPATLPAVPRIEHHTNSPGTHLAFRLPQSAAAGWRLCIWGVICAVCNLLALVFGGLAIRGHVAGAADWWLDLFALGLAAAGAWLLARLLRQLLVTTGFGPTVIEISEYPLEPGRTYDLRVSQAGRLSVHRFELRLVCRETVSYRQGTDVRMEVHTVFDAGVLSGEDVTIEAHEPWVHDAKLSIPRYAMHSFHSASNEIQWGLVATGEAIGFEPFERTFPLVVHPGPAATVPREPTANDRSASQTTAGAAA